jgi:hypothetical protein
MNSFGLLCFRLYLFSICFLTDLSNFSAIALSVFKKRQEYVQPPGPEEIWGFQQVLQEQEEGRYAEWHGLHLFPPEQIEIYMLAGSITQPAHLSPEALRATDHAR